MHRPRPQDACLRCSSPGMAYVYKLDPSRRKEGCDIHDATDDRGDGNGKDARLES